MTVIERLEPQAGQQDIAVTIVDTDVHPLPVSADVLKSYAPAEWVDKIWPTGNAASPVSHFYDTPDSYKTSSLRLDAAPPDGGVAGSDPDFAAKQMRSMPASWRGSISVSAQTPEQAAREVERWVGHPYMAQVLMTPQTRGIPFGNPHFDPLYEAAARNGSHSDFRVEKLPSIGLPSPFSPAILGFVRRFNESLSLCRAIYRKFQPNLVLGMGGFTSTAPVMAARLRGVPTFIHESNAIPGRANRMTARMVRAVLLGFKECAQFFPKVKTEFTGTPIRTELKRIDRQTALHQLGLRDDRTHVAGDGWKPGRDRRKPGHHQIDDHVQGIAPAGHSSFRRARRTPGRRQLSARKYSCLRCRIPSSDGSSLQRGGSGDRALRRGQPGGARRLFLAGDSDPVSVRVR